MTVGGTGWKFGHYKTCYAQIGCITTISKLLGGGGGGGLMGAETRGKGKLFNSKFQKNVASVLPTQFIFLCHRSTHFAKEAWSPMHCMPIGCKGGLVSDALPTGDGCKPFASSKFSLGDSELPTIHAFLS